MNILLEINRHHEDRGEIAMPPLFSFQVFTIRARFRISCWSVSCFQCMQAQRARAQIAACHQQFVPVLVFVSRPWHFLADMPGIHIQETAAFINRRFSYGRKCSLESSFFIFWHGFVLAAL